LPISDAGGLDLDTKLANTNEITAARMGALTDWINGGRLDLLLDALQADLDNGTDGLGALKTLIDAVPTVTEFNARSLPSADYTVVGDTIAGVTAVTNDVGITQAAADKVWGTAARTLTSFGTLITDLWHHLLTGITTAGSIGKLIKDYLDAAISSRSTVTTAQVNTEVDNALNTAIPGAPTAHSINQRVKAIDELTEASGGGDLAAITTHLTDVKGATFAGATDSLEAIRDRGDAAWTTGGGGSISDILNVQPLIPNAIDLANTVTLRISLGLTNMLDDLPSTAEITPGTITIDRKAIGGTSWTNIVNAAACSELAGLIYYDEVFDSGTGYAAGDTIRITFKSQKIAVAANDYEITGTDGWIFHTYIREAMRGTNNANTTTPPTVGEIQTEMEENGASLLDTIRDDLDNATDGLGALKTLIDAIPTTAMRGTDNAALASGVDLTHIMGTILTEGAAGRLAAAFIKLLDVATPLLVASDVMRGTDGANTTVPDAAGTAPTASEIQTEMEENGASLLDTIRDIVSHGTYGNSALQVLIAALQTDLDNGTDGLGALKTLIDACSTHDAAAVKTAIEAAGSYLKLIKAKTDNLPSGIAKNVALSNFEFLMIDSTDHVSAKTGLTVTAQISKDGGAFASCTNSVAEIGSGLYKIDLTQAEMNANIITLKFTATGADQRTITIKTS
jgi:hypothetical protein